MEKQDKDLDRVGRMLLRAAALNDEESEAAVSSPFLYLRIRATIAAEERRRSQMDNGWLAILLAARQAVPAMAIITVAIVGMFLAAILHTPATDSSYLANNPPPPYPTYLVSSVAACSLSTKAECIVSNNDVLATIFSQSPE